MVISFEKLILSTRFRKNQELTLNLGSVEISDSQIKYDFELLDRYQNFSSEILRLALIGIGVYAFFIKEANAYFSSLKSSSTIKGFSIASIICFAIATAASLAHRYYSSDFMAYHIRYLRLKITLKNQKAELTTEEKETAISIAASEKCSRDVILQFCEVLIATATFFLGTATIFLAISIMTVLF